MRKLLLFLACVGISFFSVHAQSVTVYNLPYDQGFETGLDGWTVVDYNNDGHTWTAATTSSTGFPGHGGTMGGFARSASFEGGSDFTPDDFLISPRIAVTSSAVLSWWYRVANSAYPADHYSVYISTGGSTVADFLATTPVVSITPTGADFNVWTNATVDLSAYVGDTISIAFRHHDCYGQFAIMIDDVSVDAFTSPWTVADTMPWSTDFDTPDTGWTFLGRSNGWFIGTPGGLSGSGMYVSGDNGVTNSYNKVLWDSRFHWAVRPLHFSDSGDYRVDYDWKADGYLTTYTNPYTYYDHVRLMLAPVTAELDTQYFFGYGISSYTNSLIPAGWISLSDTNGMHLLANSPNWTHHAQSFHVPAAGDYLLLVLAVNGNSSTFNETAPAIDNLSLSSLSCYNSIDTLRLTAISNQGLTVGWDDSVASQWAVYVGDSLCGVTTSNSFYLANPALCAATCNATLRPVINVSSICAAGDTALPATMQAVWKNNIAVASARTVSCFPFTLPYGENFDGYLHDDSHCFGWTNFGEIGQYIENYQSHSGSLSLNMRALNLPSGKKQLLVSPRFDAPGNQLLVSFWAKLPAYSGADADTLFQAGVLFNHDTMDYAHVAENTTPMLTLLGSDANGSWVHYQFTTDVFTDTTPASITLSLVPHSNSWYDCYIDDIEVSLIAAGQDSVPPTVAVTGPVSATAFLDTVTFTATLIQGDTTGLTYTWHSSLTGLSFTGASQWSMVYSVVGVDTLTLIASNLYGSDTAELFLTVTDNLTVSLRGASTAFTGDTLHYTAVVSGPDTVALSFSWHSTMADAGLAQFSILNSQFSICYSANGTDTLTLTVTNSHGPHIVTRIVTVQSCGVIATFPYSEDFENYGWQNRSACWLIRTPEGLVDNEWRRSNAGHNSSPYCMYSNGNSTNRAYAAWLITPAIELPSNVDSVSLGFAQRNQYLDHFDVLVSPTGDPYYDGFTDTVYSLYGTGYNLNWDSVSLSLNAYRGRHIRIAFVHSSNGGSMGTIRIDDLSIKTSTDTTPVVPPSPDTVWRSVLVSANVEGACVPFGGGRYVDSSAVEIGFIMADSATEGGFWRFLGWSDGPSENPRLIFVTSDTAFVALFQWVADSLGIDNVGSPKLKVELYPNPTQGDVTVSVSGPLPASVSVVDLTGRVVLPPTPLNSQFSTLNSQLSILNSNLPSGTYFVRVVSDSALVVKKLIVK